LLSKGRAGAKENQQAQAAQAQQQASQQQIEAQQRQIEALQQQNQQPQSQPQSQQEDVTQKLQKYADLTRNSRNSKQTCYQKCNL
jgi:hypothetical protein